ncbi:MAG: hypothetical protein C4527_25635 [Candidatus Omnitrophota bacterium]|nr:MAG: hypothetical protein C4527_25635 [Candidatus Omnitrophota bacterium]
MEWIAFSQPINPFTKRRVKQHDPSYVYCTKKLLYTRKERLTMRSTEPL